MSDARTDRRSCADMWLKQLQDSNDVSCLGIYTPPEHNTCISIATPRCRFVEEVSSTSIDHAPGLSSARLHVWSGCVAFYPALDGDIWWLRLLSAQQPTTRVVLQALARDDASEGSTLGRRFGIATRAGRTQCGLSGKGLTRMTSLCKLTPSCAQIRELEQHLVELLELQAKRLACSPSLPTRMAGRP